jgi:hypothetical protein
MKTGASVIVTLSGGLTKEAATICRTTRVMRPLPAGYVPVRFASDGARLVVHASQVRAA